MMTMMEKPQILVISGALYGLKESHHPVALQQEFNMRTINFGRGPSKEREEKPHKVHFFALIKNLGVFFNFFWSFCFPLRPWKKQPADDNFSGV